MPGLPEGDGKPLAAILFTRQKTVNVILDSWRFLQREAGLVI